VGKSGGHGHAALDEAGILGGYDFLACFTRDIGQTNILRKLHARTILRNESSIGWS